MDARTVVIIELQWLLFFENLYSSYWNEQLLQTPWQHFFFFSIYAERIIDFIFVMNL